MPVQARVQKQMVANYISANTDNKKITLKFEIWQEAEWVFFTPKDLKADKRVGNGMVRAAFLQWVCDLTINC